MDIRGSGLLIDHEYGVSPGGRVKAVLQIAFLDGRVRVPYVLMSVLGGCPIGVGAPPVGQIGSGAQVNVSPCGIVVRGVETRQRVLREMFDLLGARFAPINAAPPMTLLGVSRLALPELMIEFEATAVD
jgi:hypothetical protein